MFDVSIVRPEKQFSTSKMKWINQNTDPRVSFNTTILTDDSTVDEIGTEKSKTTKNFDVYAKKKKDNISNLVLTYFVLIIIQIKPNKKIYWMTIYFQFKFTLVLFFSERQPNKKNEVSNPSNDKLMMIIKYCPMFPYLTGRWLIANLLVAPREAIHKTSTFKYHRWAQKLKHQKYV